MKLCCSHKGRWLTSCCRTELVEVFAINTMAPFILNKRAIPLLQKVLLMALMFSNALIV